MAQKLDVPQTDGELRSLLDSLYTASSLAKEKGLRPSFKGLLECISVTPVILTAIHKIKANKGSSTPGSDGQVMQDDFLDASYEVVIERVRSHILHHQPNPVRRVFIPKPGKSEKRPLGIPAIIDRIVQECVRIVLEPILEAQFFSHSYGFRPMRDAHMALARVTGIVHLTGYKWIVEGDISKFFDNVDHTVLIKKLWGMGVHDRRALMIIKAMLEAGIMNECRSSTLGTPQGGIISPLLANVYLDSLDQWVSREWEDKRTRVDYARHDNKILALRHRSNLKPAYFIRYADDWVLVTDTKENAEKWKWRITRFLKDRLKLELSAEKTLITNIRKKAIKFVGFHYKEVKGKSRTGYVQRTRPDPTRLNAKVKEIHRQLHRLKKLPQGNIPVLIDNINRINSVIRGVIQFYKRASWVSVDLSRHSSSLNRRAKVSLRRHNGIRVPAKLTNNLTSVHSDYDTLVNAIRDGDMLIGITSLGFCRFDAPEFKNPLESPYTTEGRSAYQKRTSKVPLRERADELLSPHLSRLIARGWTHGLYTFEYFMNRAYAFNRDKGKCRVCSTAIAPDDVEIHHRRPRLPIHLVNKVGNLLTLDRTCHGMIHGKQADILSDLPAKIRNKVMKYNAELNM